jgi:hypothetical protein
MSMTEQKRPQIRLMGDSIGDGNGNHFIVRYDENNKPSYFEVNGKPVSELEYRVLRGGQFRH